MSDTTRTYYDVLGLSTNASFMEIKSQYRKLLLQNHPDKQSSEKSDDTTDVFLEIESAWRTLSDQTKRQEYDAQLKEREVGQSAPFELEIELEDMVFDDDTKTYRNHCRCGGEYVITTDQLEEGYSIVPCSSCTLQAQVN